MPVVTRITIFPVKSCDGISCSQVDVLPSGALRHDRQFALVDATGRFINAKRTALIHQVRLTVDPESRLFTAARRDDGDPISGHLDHDGRQLSDWLSHFFSLEVSLVENVETGFPDDLEASGPTVVSSATLETVASWYPGLTVDNIRCRFRANIEIDGAEPFWEDRLFREDRKPQPFRIGAVTFGGTNPCQRCVVPTRDPWTGDVAPAAFAQVFRQQREKSLPAWAARNRFDHFYRLTTNTQSLQTNTGTIRLGDVVEICDAR
jgi:uncharacterized protein